MKRKLGLEKWKDAGKEKGKVRERQFKVDENTNEQVGEFVRYSAISAWVSELVIGT